MRDEEGEDGTTARKECTFLEERGIGLNAGLLVGLVGDDVDSGGCALVHHSLKSASRSKRKA